MVLPIGEVTITEDIEVTNASDLPTKTYKLDLERGRCVGLIDALKAMEQAIFKRLYTIRFAHTIYSDDYGFESMTGYEEIFVRGDLPRRIKEALLQDERITSIEDFMLDFEGDAAFVSFTAVTIYGDVRLLREVIPFVRSANI